MKDNPGFTRFEFYFAICVIGVIVLIGIQRYLKVTDEVRRLSVEIIAKNFNSAVYFHHARWLIAQQKQTTNTLTIDGRNIHFSSQGWPLTIVENKSFSDVVSLNGCLSLWNNFLQNPPGVSYESGEAYGTHAYHLRLASNGACRFELVGVQAGKIYFDYSPLSGKVSFQSLKSENN